MATEPSTKDTESQTTDTGLSTHLLNPDIWIRLLYMMIFGVLSVLARMVIWVIAALQFLFILLTGQGNSNLQYLGQGTSKWVYQAYLFLTFNSDHKPFPFSDWPDIEASQASSYMAGDVDSVQPPSDTTVETTGASGDADDVPTFLDSAVVDNDREKK